MRLGRGHMCFRTQASQKPYRSVRRIALIYFTQFGFPLHFFGLCQKLRSVLQSRSGPECALVVSFSVAAA